MRISLSSTVDGFAYLFAWCIRRDETNSSHWRIIGKVCTMMLVKWCSGRRWWTISVVTVATWMSFFWQQSGGVFAWVRVLWIFALWGVSFLGFHETWGLISTFWGWDFLNLVFLWDFWILVVCFDIPQKNFEILFLF